MYIYVYTYAYILIFIERESYKCLGVPSKLSISESEFLRSSPWTQEFPFLSQDSSKGGAVETGCSDLYDVCMRVYYIILPQSTAPPSDCTPL